MRAPKPDNELTAKIALHQPLKNGAASIKAKKTFLVPGMAPNFSSKKVSPKAKSAWQTAMNMWT